MADNLLVDYYYGKLLEFSTGYKTHFFIIKQDFRIKQEISKIIDSNNHYFLTESVLCYISRNDHIIDTLKNIYTSDLDRFKTLIEYYHDCMHEVYKNKYCSKGFKWKDLSHKRYDIKKKVNYSTAYLLSDNITKEKIDSAVEHLKYFYGHIVLKSEYIDKILCIILSYCHMNNTFDEFDDICNIFKLDTDYMIEDFELNKLDLDRRLDYLIDRVVYFIVSRDQRRTIM